VSEEIKRDHMCYIGAFIWIKTDLD